MVQKKKIKRMKSGSVKRVILLCIVSLLAFGTRVIASASGTGNFAVLEDKVII
jgi:hypothetical protein